MTARRFAMILGAFLLVEGIWGLFSPVVFGMFATNMLHAVIHIALGIIGVLAARSAAARKYLMFTGGLLLAVGILRFIPGASDLVVSLLNVNVAVGWLNIIVGAVSLLITMTDKSANDRAAAMT